MSRKRIKIDGSILVVAFLSLYTIMPTYFVLGGFTVRNLLAFAFLLFSVLLRGILIVDFSQNLFWATCIWTVCTAFCQFLHLDVKYAVQTLIVWIFVLAMSSSAIRSKETFLRVIDALIWSGGVVGCLGIVEEFTHFNVFSLLNTIGYTLNYNEPRFGLLRIISFTSHAITYCLYCMMILALIFYRVTLPITRNKKIYILCYCLVFGNACLTLSRSALLCVIGSQLFLLWKCGFIKFIKKMGIIVCMTILIGGILMIVSPQIEERVLMVINMFLAVFDDGAEAYISSAGFGGNAGGIGQRFLLYKWVWNVSQDTLLIGKGRGSVFSYYYFTESGRYVMKESIEVELLRTFYRYGLVGLIGELSFFIGLIGNTAKRRKKQKRTKWEGALSFSTVCFVAFLFYIMCMFAVMQNEDAQILFAYVTLFLAYDRNKGFDVKDGSSTVSRERELSLFDNTGYSHT